MPDAPTTPKPPPETVDVNIRLVTVDVEAFTVRPGDTVLIQLDPTLTVAEFSRMYSSVAKALPGVQVILIPTGKIVVKRGPQLDDPARPLVPTAETFYEHAAATHDPTRPGYAQGRPVF